MCYHMNKKIPWVTCILVVMNAILYFATPQFSMGAHAGDDFFQIFGSAFGHANLAHLVGNMLFLFAAGSLVEIGLGPVVMLITYILSAIGSAYLFLLFNPDSGIIGASGAIMGMVVLVPFTLFLMNRSIGGFIVSLTSLAIIVGYFVLQFNGLLNGFGGVAYLGHFGGAMTALFVGPVFCFADAAIRYWYFNRHNREYMGE